jgi:muconolactone delta-isomerase
MVMNILVTTNYKEHWYTLPEEKRSEITAKMVAFHEKYLKEGTLKDTYTFMGGKLISVWNVDSYDEMVSIMIDHPYRFYADIENEPFVDHQGVLKILQERS